MSSSDYVKTLTYSTDHYETASEVAGPKHSPTQAEGKAHTKVLLRGGRRGALQLAGYSPAVYVAATV